MIAPVTEQEVEQEEYEYAVTDSSGQSEEDLIPPGRYEAEFCKFHVEDKPAWKLDQQRKYNPDKEPKPTQAVWTFELVEDGYEGRKLSDWQDVSWHVKSNGAKYLAALLGKSKLTGTERGTIKQLLGRRISIRVTESKGRNYIDPNGCEPVSRKAGKRTAGSSPQEALQRLQAAIDATHMQRGEVLAVWTELGYKGRTRDSLSPSELDRAIARYEEIAAPLADTDPSALAF